MSLEEKFAIIQEKEKKRALGAQTLRELTPALPSPETESPAELNARIESLQRQLSHTDALAVGLQEALKEFENKEVIAWPQEGKLSPELRGLIISFLERGDMGGLENLLDRLIRYDDKLPTLLKHTYFKEKVEEVYGRYFKHRGSRVRRGSDTAGTTLPAVAGSTTLGFGPSGSGLGLLFIDLDNFKAINDTMGHEAGDAALQRVAAAISETLRQADIKGRYGGEELEVAVELENPMDGQKVAQKIVNAIAALTIEYKQFKFHVTASVGVAELQQKESLDDLIDRANWAMKYAKHMGKNKQIPAELDLAIAWAEKKKEEEALKKEGATQTP